MSGACSRGQMRTLKAGLPIFFNIIGGLFCKWNAQKIFDYLELDERLLMDGQVPYRIGTGAVLLIIMLSIGFVTFMDVCWIVHFLKWYSLIAVIQGYLQPRPPM